MEVRSLTQKFIDDFLGYYINPQNRFMNSLLIGPGLPGGMMGSLMSDLQKNLSSVNKWLKKNKKEEITQDQLLIKLFNEVEYVWPKLGYPPLVTPYSQYVKNLSLINVMQILKDRKRWSLIDENTWGMILGQSGELLGDLDDEIINLAKSQERTFFTGTPSDLFDDELDIYRAKMKEKGWDLGEDDEELMEYAMHPQQYEDYKSGKAKEGFLKDLEAKKAKKRGGNVNLPQTLEVEIDGQKYKVSLKDKAKGSANNGDSSMEPNGVGNFVVAPLEGTFYLTKDAGEQAKKTGDKIKEGDTIGYIESMKVINAITSEFSGTIGAVMANNGDEVEEDAELFKIV
jgi:pyruvate carboxylase subunit B